MRRPAHRLREADYRTLLAFRDGLRRFERWSEQRAAEAGLTPAQHQLLLAVRGHGDSRGPTIGDIADHLLLQHHSAVGLVERAVIGGFVVREDDRDDRRVVRVRLTDLGTAALEDLSALHLEELSRLAGELDDLWDGLEVTTDHPDAGRQRERRSARATTGSARTAPVR